MAELVSPLKLNAARASAWGSAKRQSMPRATITEGVDASSGIDADGSAPLASPAAPFFFCEAGFLIAKSWPWQKGAPGFLKQISCQLMRCFCALTAAAATSPKTRTEILM